MKKLLVLFLVLLISLISVNSIRYVNYNFYEGLILFNGSLIKTNKIINDVNIIGFTCFDKNCENLGERIFENKILNSGLGSSIQLNYPTELLSGLGYGVYYYRDMYIPWESNPNWFGTNFSDPQGPYNIYLSKKEMCAGFISNLVVENTIKPHLPLVVFFEAGIDADTWAAIREAGPLKAVPKEIENQYTIKQSLILDVYNEDNELVDHQIKDLIFSFGEKKSSMFTIVPENPGKLKIVLRSNVNDEKCLSSKEISISKETIVLDEERPRNMCYTLIENLNTDKLNAKAGDTLIIKGKKISNKFRNINASLFVDRDNDGFSEDIDCDDNDNAIYPRAPELIDNINQNCVNDVPFLEVSDIEIFEGELAVLKPNVYDVDGDKLDIQYSSPFNEKGEWKTKITDNRIYSVFVKASDGKESIIKKVKVNVKKIPGRDMWDAVQWDLFRNNIFTGKFDDDRTGNKSFPLPYVFGTLSKITTNVYMKNDRTIGFGFFCSDLLDVKINGKLQFSLREPGFEKRFSDPRARFISETRMALELKKGWNQIELVCDNHHLSRSDNKGHIDIEPRLSSVVDLMVSDNKTVDINKIFY